MAANCGITRCSPAPGLERHPVADLDRAAARIATLGGPVRLESQSLVEGARPGRVPEGPKRRLGERGASEPLQRVADQLSADPSAPGIRVDVERPDLPDG